MYMVMLPHTQIELLVTFRHTLSLILKIYIFLFLFRYNCLCSGTCRFLLTTTLQQS